MKRSSRKFESEFTKSRKYHELNNRKIEYKVGDLVMYKTHPTSKAVERTTSKLSYRWCGPYPVSYTHLDVYKRQS